MMSRVRMSIISVIGSCVKFFSCSSVLEPPFPIWCADVDDGVVAAELPPPLAALPEPAPPSWAAPSADARYSPPAISICVLPMKSDMAATRRRISVRLMRLLLPPFGRDQDLLWWLFEVLPEAGLFGPLSGTSRDRERVAEFWSSRASRSLVYWLRPFFLCIGRPPLLFDMDMATEELGGGVSGDGCEGRAGADRCTFEEVGVADEEDAFAGAEFELIPAEVAVGVAAGAAGIETVRFVAAERDTSGTSSEGSESAPELASEACMSAVEASAMSLPSPRRRSARPLRLLAASARCRSFSSFSDRSRCCCVRDVAAPRDDFFDDPLRVAIASSESSAAVDLSAGGDSDRELVRCRLVLSAFLRTIALASSPPTQTEEAWKRVLFTLAATALRPSRIGIGRVAFVFLAGLNGNPQLLLVVGRIPAIHGRAPLSRMGDG